MKTVTLNGSLREKVGSKFAKVSRKEGLVPAVIYGSDNNVHLTIDERELNKIIYTADVFNVVIDVDGTKYSTIFQDAQYHPVSDACEHADFLLVTEDKPVVVSLPVALTGNSIGVRNGGKLRKPLRKLKVKGLISALPDNIEIDITKLRIGRSVKVGEISIDGVEILDPASNVVVSVKTARGAVDAGDDEEGEEAAAEASAEA